MTLAQSYSQMETNYHSDFCVVNHFGDLIMEWSLSFPSLSHSLSPSLLDFEMGKTIDIILEGIGNRARAPYISIERSGDTPGSC